MRVPVLGAGCLTVDYFKAGYVLKGFAGFFVGCEPSENGTHFGGIDGLPVGGFKGDCGGACVADVALINRVME